jgi:transcriptional regulator with XRE-family HTH domain
VQPLSGLRRGADQGNGVSSMNMCEVCGGRTVTERIVPSYEADLLGAPFTVMLESSVREESCVSCGAKLKTFVPDLEGLLHAVAITRALTPRKLVGEEIKFLRNAMGWKAKDVAKYLELGPEHLSRCENGSKTLSPLAEKWFRLFVIVKVFEKSLNKRVNLEKVKEHIDIDRIFGMKIESTWNSNERLRFHFVHHKVEEPDLFDASHEGKWEPEELRAA